MSIASDVEHRTRDRQVTALKSALFETGQKLAEQLRSSSKSTPARNISETMHGFYVQITVEADKKLWDDLEVNAYNEAMAAAVDQAVNIAIGNSHSLKGNRFAYASKQRSLTVKVSAVMRGI